MQPRSDRPTLLNGRYCPDLVLGTGTYGHVLRCYDNVTGKRVAIKVAHREAAYRRAAINERNVLKLLNEEPTVVKLLDSFEENGRIHLVTEILYKNLYEVMRDQKFVIVPLDIVRDVAKVILTALQQLHATDHIHCDIKPENVMLRSPKSFHDCCVIDFGAVRASNENQYYDIQSLWYRAPEVICGVPYTRAIDVWSVGCLLYELHTGNPILQGNDPQDQLSLIIQLVGVPSQEAMTAGNCTGKLRFTVPNSSPRPRIEDSVVGDPTSAEQFCDFLYQLLVPDEAQRYTVAEALAHPFITGSAWNGPTSLRMNFQSAFSASSSEGLSSTTSSPEWKRHQQFEDDDEPNNTAEAIALAGTELPISLHQSTFGPPSIDDWN